ncbi:orc1/cdc6 family replication initiation protein [Halomarina ordinaria]|uniref:ORC1-type DNA replication protein n=1 Tax=Halomarina ordinaria TaxID=3033939 RepID=A0ABD5U9T6_9EURY|nr:orc1/cdc6 family replication initiation protein [Halomarina sp. PSRA2]
MGGPFSEINDTLFADKRMLEEEYQPETILERDAEVEAYQHALKDVLFGRNPANIFAYGKTGVGKTAVTKYMLAELATEARRREAADDVHLLIHNCNGASVYGTLRSLINDLRPAGEDPFPKKGLSVGDALEEFYARMDERGGTFLLVLDEIDHIDDPDPLLYDLPRARANGHLETARVGVIGISNNYRFRESLSPKVRDTLMEKEISFSPYDAGELVTILEHRAERAYVESACDGSAIRKAAALAARDTGGARQALDLLRTAGDLAEQRGDATVTDDHVGDAQEVVRRGRITNKIRDQTIHGQLVLEAVTHLNEHGRTPARSKEIQRAYERTARNWDRPPLTTLRSVQSHLGDLHMLGFLARYERNDGRDGGAYFEYDLNDIHPDAVVETREAIEAEYAE